MSIVKEILQSKLDHNQKFMGLQMQKASTVGEMQELMVQAIINKVKSGEKKDIKILTSNIRTQRTKIKTTAVEKPMSELEIARL